ncbi:MAG: hypothetical protein MMC33_002589 [Icmadophila ericetorum]|nr:hypothetical protein [Icmadophila ericetorum]
MPSKAATSAAISAFWRATTSPNYSRRETQEAWENNPNRPRNRRIHRAETDSPRQVGRQREGFRGNRYQERHPRGGRQRNRYQESHPREHPSEISQRDSKVTTPASGQIYHPRAGEVLTPPGQPASEHPERQFPYDRDPPRTAGDDAASRRGSAAGSISTALSWSSGHDGPMSRPSEEHEEAEGSRTGNPSERGVHTEPSSGSSRPTRSATTSYLAESFSTYPTTDGESAMRKIMRKPKQKESIVKRFLKHVRKNL